MELQEIHGLNATKLSRAVLLKTSEKWNGSMSHDILKKQPEKN